MKGIVEAAGSSPDKVARTTVFLADMNEFAAMNEVYSRYFSGAAAGAVHGASRAVATRDVRVEIDVIALA